MSTEWQSSPDGSGVVTEHRLPEGIGSYELLYFPIHHGQLRDLLGKILTQVESMNLAPVAERATKAIFTQMAWRWFDEVMENCVTSAIAEDGKPCIAPIILKECPCEEKGGCSNCSFRSNNRIRFVQMQTPTEPNK